MERLPSTRDYQRTTLKPRHRRVVGALAEAFFAPDGEATAEALDAHVVEVDQFISPASKTLRFGLLLVLDVLRVVPFFMGRLRAFDELAVDDRVHVLERLEGSRVVQLPLLVVAYKTIMTVIFYESPEELRSLGYSEERRRYRSLPLASAPPTEREATP